MVQYNSITYTIRVLECLLLVATALASAYRLLSGK